MTTRLLLLICLIGTFHTLNAQTSKRANIWYFGRNAGLDFNVAPPAPISTSTLNTWEGCATMCDENGQLLMYTDGSTVWNKLHKVIQNATYLGGNSSSSQSGIIVPKPLSKENYYIISVDAEGGAGGVQYCEINIAANAGLGVVISKNTILLTQSLEKLTTVPHCNGRDYWIIAHQGGSDKFFAWLLTPSGINVNNPVISSVGNVYGSYGRAAIGYMRSSPDGSRIACAANIQSLYEIFDFDKKTGRLSNPIQLQDARFLYAYGIEFSPDGKLLYISSAQASKHSIYQVDLTATNSASMMNSLVEVGRSNASDFGALQLAPNGQIYIAQDGSITLSVIESPNTKGVGCRFIENAIKLLKPSGFGLPNLIPSLFVKPIIAKINQSPGSCGSAKLEALTDSNEPVAYQWYLDGQALKGETNAAITSAKAGSYKVRVFQKKECDTLQAYDSVRVNVSVKQLLKPVITASALNTICQGSSLTLVTSTQDSVGYDWYKGP